ncbi:MAG: preprotein translocase subunit TatB [Gammaproteobacteria bacterium]|nr:preprotein translocase subunit TatB [Gammaproteobacteria bacterium]
MLDFGFSEFLLTSAIALVVLGPERLPKVARQVGNWMGRARAMARQLSEQLEREVSAEELMREQNKPKAPAANRIAPPLPDAPLHGESQPAANGHDDGRSEATQYGAHQSVPPDAATPLPERPTVTGPHLAGDVDASTSRND